MSAKLPTGPPEAKLEVRFTMRELEFIELRYGQAQAYKEIAASWNLSASYVRNLGAIIFAKLGLQGFGNDAYILQILATKRLIELGYVQLERNKSCES